MVYFLVVSNDYEEFLKWLEIGQHLMKIMTKYSTILLLLIVSLGTCYSSTDLSELKPYLKKSLSWQCTDLNRTVPLNIYYLEDKTGPDGRDIIVYITNRAWERIGQESDISILSDFIKKKFIVITLDFGNDSKASSPFIDNDISEIYSALFGYKRKSLLKDIGLVPKEYRCFGSRRIPIHPGRKAEK